MSQTKPGMPEFAWLMAIGVENMSDETLWAARRTANFIFSSRSAKSDARGALAREDDRRGLVAGSARAEAYAAWVKSTTD